MGTSRECNSCRPCCFRIESIYYKRRDGQAKILGIVVCVVGATLITVYKGPAVFGDSNPSPISGFQQQQPISGFSVAIQNWGIDEWHFGALCLLFSCFSAGAFVNLQVWQYLNSLHYVSNLLLELYMAPNTMLWTISECSDLLKYQGNTAYDCVSQSLGHRCCLLRNCKACINLKKRHKVCVGIVGFKVLSICYLVSIHVTMGNFSDDTSYE